MAFNDVSEEPDAEHDVFERLGEMTSNCARFHAVMFDADACALSVFGMSLVKAVAKGLGRVAPLADPLGEDLPELERGLEVIGGAAAWLDYRRRTVGDRLRGAKGFYSEHDRYGKSSPAESLATFKADRPEVFGLESATETYDLEDPADLYDE